MKKKGFTLVELLAVIAILAILVIIALPNIMELFNQAKKNSFENEVKEIYKTAQSQWLVDSMSGARIISYSRGADGNPLSCTTGDLKLSGRSDIQYAVTLDEKGAIIELFVMDGNYQVYVPDAENLENITDLSGHIYSNDDGNLTGIYCISGGWDLTLKTN